MENTGSTPNTRVLSVPVKVGLLLPRTWAFPLSKSAAASEPAPVKTTCIWSRRIGKLLGLTISTSNTSTAETESTAVEGRKRPDSGTPPAGSLTLPLVP